MPRGILLFLGPESAPLFSSVRPGMGILESEGVAEYKVQGTWRCFFKMPRGSAPRGIN